MTPLSRSNVQMSYRAHYLNKLQRLIDNDINSDFRDQLRQREVRLLSSANRGSITGLAVSASHVVFSRDDFQWEPFPQRRGSVWSIPCVNGIIEG